MLLQHVSCVNHKVLRRRVQKRGGENHFGDKRSHQHIGVNVPEPPQSDIDDVGSTTAVISAMIKLPLRFTAFF